jgi:nucleotide-binding universal stress UspA family protein
MLGKRDACLLAPPSRGGDDLIGRRESSERVIQVAQPILVGYDPRAGDRAPVDFGVAAARFTGAPLIVASAGVSEEEHTGEAGESLEQLRRELAAEGVAAECRSVEGRSAPHALHTAAEEVGAGLLVVGSSGRGSVGRLLPGSTAQRLMHGAPCPIAVVPHGWTRRGELRTIGVAFVETPEGRAALDGTLALARRARATVRVLSVARPHGFGQTFGGGDPLTPATRFDDVASGIRVATERAVEEATAGDGAVEVEPDVSVGDPAEFLIAASENLDLLVCGSRGYGPSRAVLLGGVSRRVTAEARCPVIVLVRGPRSGLEDLIGEQSEAVG